MSMSDGLFDQLRQGAGPVWRDYVDHPFVQGIGDGTLPLAAFRRYLVQDYLFLKHFVRAYALAGYKSLHLDELQAASAAMGALLGEMRLHVAYCAEWGVDEAAIGREPEALETIAYTRFALEQGNSGDLLDLHVALIPCVLGYAEIGTALASRATPGNPYRSWIEMYAGEEYGAVAHDAVRMLERIGARRGAAARLPELQKTFNTATALEIAFWEMGWRARRD